MKFSNFILALFGTAVVSALPSEIETRGVRYMTQDGQVKTFNVIERKLVSRNPALDFAGLDVDRRANGDPGTFSCAGSVRCATYPGLVSYCDHAKQYLTQSYTYTTNGDTLTGNCWADVFGYGCGVFVAGPKGCYRSGAALQAAYDHIRSAGCTVCGINTGDDGRGDACEVKIDYVSGCDNRG